MLEENAAARSQGLAAARRPMGSAALWRACFARAAPHSASLSLLLFLNVSGVGEVPLREGRQILVREEWLTESSGKVKFGFWPFAFFVEFPIPGYTQALACAPRV